MAGSWLNSCAPQRGDRVPPSTAALPGRGNPAGYAVLQAGRLISGNNLDARLSSLSITKSFASLAVADAVAEGWLEFDAPLVTILPEWRAQRGKENITLRLLLNQSAGFRSGVPQLYRGVIPDKGRTAIRLPLIDPPGSRFRYGPASWEIIAEVMKRRLADRGITLRDHLVRLMSRIGISSPGWRMDGGGTPYFSTGAEFSVRDLGQLGGLLAELSQGRNSAGWKAAIFQDMVAPRPANPMVSSGIWWNRNAARNDAHPITPERELDAVRPPAFWSRACLSPSADPDWLALVGSGGRRVYVLPGRRIVIARIGRLPAGNEIELLNAFSA